MCGDQFRIEVGRPAPRGQRRAGVACAVVGPAQKKRGQCVFGLQSLGLRPCGGGAGEILTHETRKAAHRLRHKHVVGPHTLSGGFGAFPLATRGIFNRSSEGRAQRAFQQIGDERLSEQALDDGGW